MTKKPILADMHSHLHEKNLKPSDWWNAVISKKLSIVAITEHAEYNPESAFKKLKNTQPKNVILIPGMEANTSAGHLLIYGTDESLYKIPTLQKIGVPIEQALKEINKHKLLASFAHPYGYNTDSACLVIGEKKTKQLLKKYKIGTEYYNGMLGTASSTVFESKWIKRIYTMFNFLDKNRITRAITLGKARKVTSQLEHFATEMLDRVRKAVIFSQYANYITTGSDAHYPHMIGSAIVELKTKPNNEIEFLEMIRRKEIKWAGPNIYESTPIDPVNRREILIGLKYAAKEKIAHKIGAKKLRKLITKRIIKQIKPRITIKKTKKLKTR